MGKYYIAFDAGTSSVKVVLYNLEMECIAEYNTPTRFEYPHSGWVQMNVDDYFEGVKNGIRACVAMAVQNPIIYNSSLFIFASSLMRFLSTSTVIQVPRTSS